MTTFSVRIDSARRVGLTLLSEGSRAHKLQLLFDLYDTDRSGYLEIDELHSLAVVPPRC